MRNIRPRITLVAMLVVFAAAFSAAADELILAEGGGTSFRIVAPASPSEPERRAVEDLRTTLAEITGADFGSASGKTGAIHVGIPAPGDRTPLRSFERRITVENGSIYLYGEGELGNVNAIYDFLRDVTGCRWFTPGDRRIPRREKLAIDTEPRSRIPSIPWMTAKHVDEGTPQQRDFARRNAIVENLRLNASSHGAHAGQRIIPSGLIPFGGRKGNIEGPARALKDKAYFETHPEFFSMNPRGKRVTSMHLCYSNPAMRDEFARNIELILADENYRGEWRLFGIGQDDNGGNFCCCPACRALEKKYDHPGGPYYDFLFDICGRFAKKYPKLHFRFLAYRDYQTLSPAGCMTKLPANLMPSYAPLGADFSKPFSHPSNAETARHFEAWAALADRMHWWSYPTTYPRPIVSLPLTANLHRIAENYRFAHRNKVTIAFAEFGFDPYSTLGFNDLRLYLLAELCRDITVDEQTVIAEFAQCCYGAAAPLMLRHIAELEAAEAASSRYLRWNPDIRQSDFATAANLLRWERGFDEMERLTAADPRRFSAVRRARYALDQTVIARWPLLTPAERRSFGELETVVARANAAIDAEAEELYGPLRASDPAKAAARARRRIARLRGGLAQFVARARGGKPLPAEFARFGRFFRVLPNRNGLPLAADPDAPFGLCNRGSYPKWFSVFQRRSFDPKSKLAPILPRFDAGRLEAFPHDGAYHYRRIGTVTLTPDCLIDFASISPQSGFPVGELFDPERPRRLCELHVCMALDPEKKWAKLGELVVIPLDRDDVPPPPAPKSRDNNDEFL